MLTRNTTESGSSTMDNVELTIEGSFECRICAIPAQYSYYGVIACHPCKMFFKRNANTGQETFKCDFDNHCEININTRHVCSACRLRKCLKSGMTMDKFRAPRLTRSKSKTLIKVQRQNQPEKLPVINLLQSDQSLLTANQWTLLSNLCHSYDESQLALISKRLVDTHNALQPIDVVYQTAIQEFIITVYETAGRYLLSNDDLRKLTFHDRSILLRNAADNVTCIGAAFITHQFNLLELDTFLKNIETKYGNHIVALHRWALKFINSDHVLSKLAVSLFAVSENTYSYSPHSSRDLTNPLTILDIQNKYAEITWKYLLYKYGWHEATKRFLNLTDWLMALTICMCHAQTLATHVRDVDLLVEQTELTLILDDADQITEAN